MKIIVNGQVITFEKDERYYLEHGQLSSSERSVFININNGSLWRYKKNNVLQEYLGFTAYQALGVNTPQFDIGFIGDNEKDDPGTLVFLQEFLPEKNEYSEINICGNRTLSINIELITPLIVAAVVLGDSDAVGRAGDNVLLESKLQAQEQPVRVIKIDCAKVFDFVKNSVNVLEGEYSFAWGALFVQFIKNNIENADFIMSVNKVIATANISFLIDQIKRAYSKFENTISSVEYLQKMIVSNEKRHYDKEKIGALVFLEKPGIKRIDDLCNYVQNNFNRLATIYPSQNSIALSSKAICIKESTSSSIRPSIFYEHKKDDDKKEKLLPNKNDDNSNNKGCCGWIDSCLVIIGHGYSNSRYSK